MKKLATYAILLFVTFYANSQDKKAKDLLK